MSLRIGDWSADGVEVMRCISSVLRAGITVSEFSAFLARRSEAPDQLCLDGVANLALCQLVNAGTLEIDPQRGNDDSDQRLYRLSALGRRVLKDRRARSRPIPDGA